MSKLSSAQMQQVIKVASTKLFEYCQKHNLHYTVTGVSGGLDSAITLALAEKASQLAQENNYRLNHVGLILPCHSDPKHAQRAEEVIAKFNAQKIIIPLDETFDFIDQKVLAGINQQVAAVLSKKSDSEVAEWDLKVSRGNIKARLRMMLGTYHVARLLRGLVLSTDNYSELLMGFWTIGGDVGDFGMIQKLWKGLELYDLARALEVPDSVIQARPEDGLGIAEGGDEGQLGVDYRTLDTVMKKLIEQGFDPDQDDELPAAAAAQFEISADQVRALWARSVHTRYKRQGTVVVERDEFGI